LIKVEFVLKGHGFSRAAQSVENWASAPGNFAFGSKPEIPQRLKADMKEAGSGTDEAVPLQ
jgi:hypothetical protein